jgi:hypothetical protein
MCSDSTARFENRDGGPAWRLVSGLLSRQPGVRGVGCTHRGSGAVVVESLRAVSADRDRTPPEATGGTGTAHGATALCGEGRGGDGERPEVHRS